MSELDSDFYNLEAARDKLEIITQDCRDVSEKTGLGIHLANADLSGLFVQEYHNPSSWRLTRLDEAGMNEVVEFRVQGIISDKLLPPIGALKSNNAIKQCSHLRQAVSITGLGSSAFNDVVPTIEQIFFMFMQQLPLDTIDFWRPHQVREHDAISAQTRLFTSRTQVVNVDPIPFDPLVDSNENLTRLARLSSARFIHTSDNEVEYLGRTNGALGMGNVSPEIYRVGDIVELSVSFVVWPSSRGKSRMIIQLQSMRLLDNEETNNARMKAMIEGNRRQTKGKPVLPKRKKTYTREEQFAETQLKLSKMRIDDAHTQGEPFHIGDTIRSASSANGGALSM